MVCSICSLCVSVCVCVCMCVRLQSIVNESEGIELLVSVMAIMTFEWFWRVTYLHRSVITLHSNTMMCLDNAVCWLFN